MAMDNFSGRGWAFPVHVGNRGQIELVEGDAKIKQAIRIILNTAPGERVMRPEFGCRIHEVLFWPANSNTAAVVERFVEEALARWEPRIVVHQVNASPAQVPDRDEPGKAALFIEILYQIKGQHDRRSLVYPFYLNPA
jgi:phage baseplate assembly protein W